MHVQADSRALAMCTHSVSAVATHAWHAKGLNTAYHGIDHGEVFYTGTVFVVLESECLSDWKRFRDACLVQRSRHQVPVDAMTLTDSDCEATTGIFTYLYTMHSNRAGRQAHVHRWSCM